MGPGGCDKTQEMIDEWEEKVKDLKKDSLWVAHPHLPGKQILHTKGMFGKSDIRAYGDIISAKKVAHQSKGTIASHASGLWHILRDTPKHVKEETTVSTIKRIVKDKYKRKLI